MSEFDVDQAFAVARVKWGDDVQRITAPVTAWMIDRLDLRPGLTVLDIAAGVGEPGLQLVDRLGADGRLVSTDLALASSRQARRRAIELGLSNASFQVMDAQRMSLADDSVDRAVCRFGVMLVPDPLACLTEARRVVRPGGRMAFAVWGPAEANPWPYRIRRVLESKGRMGPWDQTKPGGMFSLPDRAAIEPLVVGAGWQLGELTEIPLELRFADFDGYWEYSVDMGGEASGVLAELSDEEREEVRERVREDVREFDHDGGMTFPSLALGVLAT